MKKITAIISFLLILILFVCPLSAAAFPITGFTVQSESAMLVSLDTKTVMYSKNIDQKRYPASLTKIMTAVVVMETCKNLDEKIEVPGEALTPLLGTGLTLGNLKEGEHISIRELLYMLMVVSGADAANTLAYHFGNGNIQSFVDLMNKKAGELKMTSTHYVNTHGLHSDNHYTTISDLYKLSLHAMDIPYFMEICSTARHNVPATDQSEERLLVTTNLMMNVNSEYYYKYVRGIKTGYTRQAGRCLISTAVKDGYNYLCFVLGAPPEDKDGKDIHQEFADTENLYKWAFDKFTYRQVVNPNGVAAEVKLKQAWEKDFLQLYPEKEIAAIVPKDVDDSSIIVEPVLTDTSVIAPIEKGQIFGYAKLICAGEEVGRVNLVSKEKVERSTILLLTDTLNSIVHSVWFLIFAGLIGFLIVLIIILNILYNKRKRKYRKVKHTRKL